ncbi:MAG: LptF/LptG family permease [Candidatus Caenarcaniphilales bacterium]|nr:LptF/LptG family permease [Candidatus Caenarcaniphilales bacterium]
MRLKILDRYILNEFWLPFASSCGILTGIWLGTDEVRDAFKLLADTNVHFSIALSLILLKIPSLLTYTIPVSVIFASFSVFIKLSSDSEIIAMRSSGISLLRIAYPTILFGLIMTLINFTISELVVAWTYPTSKRIEAAATSNFPIIPFIDDFAYFERSNRYSPLRRIVHVKHVEPYRNLLKNVTILDLTRDDTDSIYIAAKGRWNTEKKGWELADGISYNISSDDPSDSKHISRFERIIIPSGKSTQEIMKKLSQIKSQNIFDISKLLKDIRKDNLEVENYSRLKMSFHQKIANPFSCVVFAFLGAPVGIVRRRAQSNMGYLLIGALILAYYVLQSTVTSFGDSGKMNAIIACWIPNVFLMGMAGYLLWRKSEFVS